MGPTKAPPAAWQGPEDLEEIRLTANLINRFEHRNSDTPLLSCTRVAASDSPVPEGNEPLITASLPWFVE